MMRPELTLLVWAAALTLVQMLAAAQGAFMQVGLMRLVGNRDGMPEITGWGGRAARAHWNMLENLVLFAALGLVAGGARQGERTNPPGAHTLFFARRPPAPRYISA